MFLIFCYSSPLLMAACLNLILVAARAIQRQFYVKPLSDDKQWEME